MLRCQGRVSSQRIRNVWLIPTIQRCKLSLAHFAQEPKRARPDSAKGTPVVILHGLFGSKQNNRSISKALANDLGTTVYAVDLRNHGESPHSEVHDYTSMADDVDQFLRELKLSPVTLIGHSMGAKVAMTVALRRPEVVERLISVDNAPVDAQLKSDFRKYVQGMRKVLQSEVSKQSDADKILKEFEESVAIRQFLLTNLSKENDTGKYKFRIPLKILGDALDKMGDFPYKDPTAHRFKGPTLFIRGTKSRYVADDVLPVIGNFFPAFRLVDIDCGHWVISEQPEAFRKAVIDFVNHVQD